MFDCPARMKTLSGRFAPVDCAAAGVESSRPRAMDPQTTWRGPLIGLPIPRGRSANRADGAVAPCAAVSEGFILRLERRLHPSCGVRHARRSRRAGMKSKIDVAKFERIVREHHAAVYRTALRVLRDDALALDATQQTFMHVLEGKLSLDEHGDVSRILRCTAAREALMLLRSAASRKRREQERARGAREPGRPPSRAPWATLLSAGAVGRKRKTLVPHSGHQAGLPGLGPDRHGMASRARQGPPTTSAGRTARGQPGARKRYVHHSPGLNAPRGWGWLTNPWRKVPGPRFEPSLKRLKALACYERPPKISSPLTGIHAAARGARPDFNNRKLGSLPFAHDASTTALAR
ncbi:MAG: sigma-70 family RNA polymerase sigma factor [Planctomycetes bacterium]|nr:sigma-70 family RNA polymerase sigma factor [Planctomycetota bacterium]